MTTPTPERTPAVPTVPSIMKLVEAATAAAFRQGNERHVSGSDLRQRAELDVRAAVERLAAAYAQATTERDELDVLLSRTSRANYLWAEVLWTEMGGIGKPPAVVDLNDLREWIAGFKHRTQEFVVVERARAEVAVSEIMRMVKEIARRAVVLGSANNYALDGDVAELRAVVSQLAAAHALATTERDAQIDVTLAVQVQLVASREETLQTKMEGKRQWARAEAAEAENAGLWTLIRTAHGMARESYGEGDTSDHADTLRDIRDMMTTALPKPSAARDHGPREGTDIPGAALLEALGAYTQDDEDGVFCRVSRQAVDEARIILERLRRDHGPAPTGDAEPHLMSGDAIALRSFLLCQETAAENRAQLESLLFRIEAMLASRDSGDRPTEGAPLGEGRTITGIDWGSQPSRTITLPPKRDPATCTHDGMPFGGRYSHEGGTFCSACHAKIEPEPAPEWATAAALASLCDILAGHCDETGDVYRRDLAVSLASRLRGG